MPIYDVMSHDGICDLGLAGRVEGLTFPRISAIAGKFMSKEHDAFQQWFQAVEQVGDFVGIRFGYIPPGQTEPEWRFYSHAKGDGIGAFADYLRTAGAHIPELPKIKCSSPVSAKALLKFWPKYMAPRKPVEWMAFQRDPSTSTAVVPQA